MESAGDIDSPYNSDRDAPADSYASAKDASTAKLSNGASIPPQEDNNFQSAISAWRSTLCNGCK